MFSPNKLQTCKFDFFFPLAAFAHENVIFCTTNFTTEGTRFSYLTHTWPNYAWPHHHLTLNLLREFSQLNSILGFIRIDSPENPNGLDIPTASGFGAETSGVCNVSKVFSYTLLAALGCRQVHSLSIITSHYTAPTLISSPPSGGITSLLCLYNPGYSLPSSCSGIHVNFAVWPDLRRVLLSSLAIHYLRVFSSCYPWL